MKRVNREGLSDTDACAMDSACDSARARRERNRALGRCINDVAAHTHELPAAGKTKCAWCLCVAAYGVEVARRRMTPPPVAIRLSTAATAVAGGASDVQVEQAIEKALDDELARN